ncbi:MAG: hypothetical protein L3J59_10400 [Methylococcaceae bacterium]|nr:hypothetical protein [Methylococcaceae bacterium]
MKVLIENSRAYYLMYNDPSGLSDKEIALCDSYLKGHRISLYRKSEVFDDICDVTKEFTSRLSQMSLMEVLPCVS